MEIDKEKVFNIIKDMLGDNANGIYVNDRYLGEREENLPIFTSDDFSTDLFPKRSQDNWVDIESGATRICLIPSAESFVIKIPITATYDYIANLEDLDWDYYNEQYYEEHGYAIEYDSDFPSAALGISCRFRQDIDLMANENDIRDKCSSITQEILVPNIYIGEWNGIKIYIQEKIPYYLDEDEYDEYDDYDVESHSYEYKEAYLKNSGIKTSCSPVILTYILIRKLGIEAANIYKRY